MKAGRVFWTKDVDLPSDIIYEYGKPLAKEL